MNINKSLEELEHSIWHTPPVDSSAIVMRCVRLHKKKLCDYSIDDVRFMIGQNIGLSHLIPYAMQKLSNNILANAGSYNGDLLKSTLTCDAEFWHEHTELQQKMAALLIAKKDKIANQPEDDFNIKNTLIDLCEHFMEASLSYSC